MKKIIGSVVASFVCVLINSSFAVTFLVHPSGLATSKSDFSPPHGSGTNSFAYDWDAAAPNAAYDAPTGYGESSFAANVAQAGVTEADRYRTLRVGLRTLFGHNVNIGDVAAISYKTKKGTLATDVDWRLTIYTTTNAPLGLPGNVGSFYRSRLQSTPGLGLNLNAPAGQWNTWTTASGANQFQFKDNRTGFQTENMTWSELSSGAVTRGANTWNYTNEEIMMIDITLGANVGGGNAISQLDGVRIQLGNGEIADIDLEQTSSTSHFDLTPAILATAKAQFSPPHGTGANPFAFDWDSAAPNASCGGAPGYGESSFAANVAQAGVTEADRYRTLRVGLRTLFGHNVNIGDVAAISYKTKKGTLATDVDWRLTIYTTTNAPLGLPGNVGSFYRSRLQSTPGLGLNLNAPAGQWNTWTTASGANQFQFKDNRTGFQTENMTWSELSSGAVTRGANTWNYTNEEIMMIDITLGANVGGGNAISQLDGVRIRLGNGEIADIGLQAAPFSNASVYVDANYTSLADGTAVTFPNGASGVEHIIGCDAFATIQGGIDAVATNGTVNVAAGTYVEDITIPKGLTLVGPNGNLNPNTQSRVAEAIVRPLTSDPDPNTAVVGVVIYIAANNVSIKGLTVDGNNTAVNSGIIVGGVDVDAIEAISSYDGVGVISISNNIIRNTTYAGLDLYNYYNGGAATSGNHIENNKFDNIGYIPYGFGVGVLIYNNFYAQISGNVMTNVRIGVQTGNFSSANPGVEQSISDNTISSTRQGIFHNLAYSAASPFTLSNNVISALNEIGATRWNGIMVSTIASTVGVAVISNAISSTPINQITTGIQIWSDPIGMTLTGGSVSGANYGVWVNNYDGYTSPGNSTALTINGMIISGATLAGVYVKDNPLDPDHSPVQATLNNCSISGTGIGLLVDGAAASAIPGNTVLTSISGDYIRLTNNSATGMNANSVVFDGKLGSAMTVNELFSTENKIQHKPDDAALGLVRFKTTNVVVTSASGSIQRGVDAATAGDTVYVGSGTFNEDVTLNKTITLIGAGAGNSVVSGPIGGAGSTFTFAATGIVLDGFTITRAGNNVTDWNNGGLNTAGVALQGAVSGAVRNCLITGMRTGIDINNASGSTFRNNVIADNRTGMILRNATDNLTVVENMVTNNWTAGILFLDGSGGSNVPFQTASNCVFAGNNISGNWYGEIVDRQTGGSLPAPGANLKNFSKNWLGTAAPVVVIANSTEPGYAAQIPVAFGGSAVNPGGAPTIAGPASANIDYTPWLHVGTDTSATIGFQGDFHTIHVDDNSAQVGLIGRIQEGINSVSGSTVLIEAGTYNENLTVTVSNLVLQGAGQLSTFIRPAISAANPCPGSSLCGGAASSIILVQASSVTIHDLTLDGDNPGLTSGIVRAGADVDARNGIITDHTLGVWNNLEVYNVTVKNIYLRAIYASSGGTFNLHNNTVQNVQGDANSIAIFNFGGAGVIANNTVSQANDAIAANNSTGTQFQTNTVTLSASGIHSDNNGSSGGVADVIEGNNVSDGTPSAFGVWVFAPYRNVIVDGNTVSNVCVGMSLAGQQVACTPVFTNNTVIGNQDPNGAGVYVTSSLFGFGSSDVSGSFGGNFITNTIAAFFLESEPGYALNVAAFHNSISGNAAGILTNALGGTFTVSAAANWWGNLSGPTIASNPYGSGGDTVSSNVTYVPWLGSGADTSAARGFQPNLVPLNFPPTHLAFTTQPGGANVGNFLSPQPVVSILDVNNVVTPWANPNVTNAIGSNPGGGALTGTNPKLANTGVATFTDLAITTSGGVGYTLVATAPYLASATSSTFDINNPLPSISTLSPFWKRAGTGAFTLTISGNNFVAPSVVYWDGTPRTTHYQSPTTLTADILAGDVANIGTALVKVSNPAPSGGESAQLTFRIEAATPAIVYSDDGYVGLPNDTLVNFPYSGSGTHIIGYDAFATVQGSVNTVTNTGLINVASGTYAENVNVSKAMTLLGANAGLAGCAGRGLESTIVGGVGAAINITSDNVTVDGFGLTGGIGFRNIGRLNVVARNNAITAGAVGMDIESIVTTSLAGVTLQGNCVTLISQLTGTTPTIGIYLSGVSGPQGLDVNTNAVSGAFYGYVLYNVNASVATIVRGGTISSAMQGVAVFNVDPVTFSIFNPTKFTLDGVSMSGFTGNYPSSPANNFHAGLYVFTGGSSAVAQINGSVSNLTIAGTGKISPDSAAIYLGDFSTGATVRQQVNIDNCAISNNLNRGISIRGGNAVSAVTRCAIANNGSDPFGAGGNDGVGIMARLGSTMTVSETFVINPSTVTAPYSVSGLFTGETPFPSMTVSRCSLFNNGNPSGQLANAYNGTINASGNWWGVNSLAGVAAMATANVDYTPWLDVGTDTSVLPGFQGDFATLNVDDNSPQTGSTGRIQEGINSVSGSTVLVGSGSYSENLVITNKITIDGAGSGNNPALDTIVTSSVANTPVVSISVGGTSALDRLTLRDLRLTGATGSGNTGAGISLLAGGSFYEFNNVIATGNGGNGFAINHVSANNNLIVSQCSFSNNGGTGFRVPTGAGMDGLDVTLSHFDGNGFGMEAYMGLGSGTVFKNVNISDSSFDNNTFKGIYVEKLSDALLQCVSVTNSGTSGTFAAGIDINLKYAAYQNIQIIDSTIVNCGTSDPANGSGIAVKARDDAPSYNGTPASLNNVTLAGLTVSGCPEGVRFGEPGKNNAGPANAHVNSCNLAGNIVGLRNRSQPQTDAQTNWWGSATGPTVVSNPGGGGVVVSTNVDFSPWLDGSADTSVGCGFQPNLANLNFTAASLVFSTQPSDGSINQPFTTQPVIRVMNENSQVATQFNAAVTLVMGNNPGLGILSGITSVNAVNGFATFSGLSIDKTGAGYTLSASAIGFPSVLSSAFQIVGPPNIITQPANVLNLPQGSNATFTVNALGALLSYQWYHGASLISGATSSSVTINNVQPADILQGWTVQISNLAGTTNSSPPAMVTLIVDSNAPSVTVSTPVKNKGTNQGAINVTGIAKDIGSGNSGIISSVKFVHNNGVTNDAEITSVGAGFWTFTSTNPIVLTAGTNTLSVWATDLAGNVSTLAPFIFYYDLTNTLVLKIIGKGVVAYDKTKYQAATNSITNVFKVGRPYVLDASIYKGTNYVFQSWVTSPTDVGCVTNAWVQKANFSFVMQSNMTITANFITNPFSALVGSFNGLFSNPTNVTHETAGFIQVKVKDKATFSGYLFFDGFKRSFTGKFRLDGSADTTVSRTKIFAQPPVNLSLDLSGEFIGGSVSSTNGVWSSEVIADKSIFSLSNPETNNAGTYTFQIPSDAGAPTNTPGGYGYGTVSNSPLGVVKLGGLLSDGQKIEQKVNLSRQGLWPLYMPLYKTPAKQYKGSAIGWITFTNGNFASSNFLNWIKKDGSSALTLYGGGFSNSVEIVGSRYTVLSPVPMKVGDWLILSGGNLPAPVTNTVSSISGARINFWNTNSSGDGSYAGAIGFRPKNGSFYPLDQTTIQGVVLQNTQNTTNISGFFIGTTQSGTMTWEKK